MDLATDEGYAMDIDDRIAQDGDSGVMIEFHGSVGTAYEFMVSEGGVGGGFEAVEFGGEVALEEGLGADVNDVSAEDDKGRMFGVDHVIPFGEVRAGVVETEMQVASQHYLKRLFHGFSRFNFDGFTMLVTVVDGADCQQEGDGSEEGCGACDAVDGEVFRDEFDDASEVEEQEGEQAVKVDDQDRAEGRVDFDGPDLSVAEHPDETADVGYQSQGIEGRHGDFQPCGRKNLIHTPDDIDVRGENQYEHHYNSCFHNFYDKPVGKNRPFRQRREYFQVSVGKNWLFCQRIVQIRQSVGIFGRFCQRTIISGGQDRQGLWRSWLLRQREREGRSRRHGGREPQEYPFRRSGS